MDDDLQLPERSSEHVIDENAKKLLLNAISSEWRLEAQDKNTEYGIDYTLEPFVKGKPTGQLVFVQLKGKGSSKKKRLVRTLKTKHINYYLFKCERPVFLVLADTHNKCGFYIYVQKYFLDKYKISDLKNQESFTFSFNPEFSIFDQEKLLNEISIANSTFMQLRLSIEEKKITLTDDRLKAAITVTSTHKQIVLSPIKPFSINVRIENEKPSEIYKFLIGESANFSSKNVLISGSPLFSSLEENTTTLEMKFSGRRPHHINVVFKNASGKEVATLIGLEGTLHVGIAVREFSAELPQSPLSVHIRCEKLPNKQGTSQFDLQFRSKIWVGKNPLRLAHFEDVRRVTNALSKNSLLSIENFFESVITPFGAIAHSSQYNDWNNYVEYLHYTRVICAQFNIEDLVFNGFSKEICEEIEMLYALILVGQYKAKISGKLTMNFRELVEPSETAKQAPDTLVIKGGLSFGFFGRKIQLSDLEVSVTDTTWGSIVKQVDGEISVDFLLGSSSIETIIWKASPKLRGANVTPPYPPATS